MKRANRLSREEGCSRLSMTSGAGRMRHRSESTAVTPGTGFLVSFVAGSQSGIGNSNAGGSQPTRSECCVDDGSGSDRGLLTLDFQSTANYRAFLISSNPTRVLSSRQ